MQRPVERVPWGSDASVFWQQQLFAIHGHFFRCPCCDAYLARLWQERDIAFHAHYCSYCAWIIFVSHSLSDWLWQRHADSRFAVWFAVPYALRPLATPEGATLMRGVWQEGT